MMPLVAVALAASSAAMNSPVDRPINRAHNVAWQYGQVTSSLTTKCLAPP